MEKRMTPDQMQARLTELENAVKAVVAQEKPVDSLKSLISPDPTPWQSGMLYHHGLVYYAMNKWGTSNKSGLMSQCFKTMLENRVWVDRDGTIVED
jgi:hypothetical protein